MHNWITGTPARRHLIAFAPGAFLLLLTVVAYVSFNDMLRTRAVVGRTRDAATAAERLISDLKDIEAGQRGYLLLGDEAYLRPYHTGLARLREDTSRLHALISNTTVQHARLDSLQALIHERIGIVNQSVAYRRAGDVDAAVDVVRSGRGRRVMDRIRALMDSLAAEEQAVQLALVSDESRKVRWLQVIFLIGVMLSGVVGYVVNRALLRFSAEKVEFAGRLEAQNRLLEDQTLELELQHDEMQQQAAELEVQQEELVAQTEALHVARDEAERANQAKSQFLGAMSHELRTPLNAIAGYVDLIQAGVYGPATAQQRDALERVQSNQRHLLTLINDILSYTGLAGGKLEIIPEEVEIAQLLQALDAMIRPQVAAKDLTYTCRPPQEGVRAWADPGRTNQILLNLLGNAIKFTASGGRVAVACETDGGDILIHVEDSGCGIPADKLDSIFEPFVQIGRSSTDGNAHGGVGLGLSISRTLARLMGGDVLVRSTLGAGSAFTLRLPRVLQEKPSPSVEARAAGDLAVSLPE